MVVKELGRLKKVDLRYIWENEATHFTPWLASEEGLALLSETIGIDLELVAVEKNVGPFRADIQCKDAATEQWVLIENQLEKTDHSHLGQLLTYAAGLKADTIIWIAQRFTEEHRSALDWLNEITDERFNFLGLEVELWRIGESSVAPKFNVISKPNNWSKNLQAAKQQGTLTGNQQIKYQFWVEFEDYLLQNKASFRAAKPSVKHYSDVSIGKSGFKLSPVLMPKEVRIDLYITHIQSKTYFQRLEEDKENIEREIGHTLVWWSPPETNASSVKLLQPNLDFEDQAQWPELKAWFLEYITKMKKVFAPRIQVIEQELQH